MSRYLIVLSICLFLCAGCKSASDTTEVEGHKDDAEPQKAPVKVATQTVALKEISSQLAIPAVVAPLPDHAVKISPAIAGKIVSVLVVPGQKVSPHAEIAELDSQHIRDQIEQAQVAIRTAEVAVRQAQDNLDIANDNSERQHKLFTAEVVSQKDVLLADNQAKTAKSQVEATQSQVKAAISAKKVLDSELEFCKVRAPIGGTVANRYLNVGDTTDPNTPIVQVVNLETVNINASLPADSSESIHLNQSAQVSTASHKDTKYKATVSFVSPQVDPVSNTIRIQLRCANSDGVLREAQNVVVEIASESKHRSIFLPRNAIVPDPDNPQNSMVYIVEDGKAKRIKIGIGATRDDLVEVISGLKPGERVITKDAYGLPEGSPVEPDSPTGTRE